MHNPARPVVTAVAAGALVLLAAGPAAAHDHLVGSEPASGATVSTAPGQVVLEFEEAPLALGARVLVTGPGGVVSTGDPQLQGDDVVVALLPGAPAGAYSVDWRVTSDDGHPVQGSFTFTAQGAAAGAAASSPTGAEPSMTTMAEPVTTPSPSPTASPTAVAAAPASSGSGGGVSGATWAWTVAAGAAGGLLGLVLMRARKRFRG